MRLGAVIGVVLFTVLCCGSVPAQPRSEDLVDELMGYLGFDDTHRQDLLDGEILFTGMPDLEPLPQAVAVAGAMVIIRRPWTELVETYIADESFRAHTDLLDSGRIPDTSPDSRTLEEIRYLESESKEARKLARVRPGHTFNLSDTEIERFARLDEPTPEQLSRLYGEILWQRYRAYRERGISAVRPYHRSSSKISSPSEELLAAVVSARFLEKRFPRFHEALKRYPEAADVVDESRFFWTKKTVSGRPTFSLVHQLVAVTEQAAVGAEREFYVGQGYNTMLTLLGVLPYEDGSILFAANRTFTDQVTGMGRALKKTMGRKLVAKKFAARFESLRRTLESLPAR